MASQVSTNSSGPPAWRGIPSWFVIAGEKSSEVGLSVPVELKNFPKDLELTGDAVNAVEVRLRASGGGRVLQQLKADIVG